MKALKRYLVNILEEKLYLYKFKIKKTNIQDKLILKQIIIELFSKY